MTDQPAGPEDAWILEALRVVRRYGPEVLDHVALLAASLADTLREPDAAVSNDAAADSHADTAEVPRLVRIDVEE